MDDNKKLNLPYGWAFFYEGGSLSKEGLAFIAR
jgi:hypothetical protein